MISANMSRVNSQQNSECRSVRRRGIMDVAETNLIGGETELKALGSVAHSDLKKQIKEELTSSNRVIGKLIGFSSSSIKMLTSHLMTPLRNYSPGN